jgi:antitoxin HicB
MYDLKIEEYDCLVRKGDNEGIWVAEYPDIPGVGAFGKSRAEAVQQGEDVLRAWLEKATEFGVEIPRPGESRLATGEFKARVPKSLHADLAVTADIYTTSLNELTTRLLTTGVAKIFAQDQLHVEGYTLCSFIPRRSGVRSINREPRDFSGTWIQRVPRVLHLHLQRLATAEGTSMSTFVIYLLGAELGRLKEVLRQAGTAPVEIKVA